MLPIAIVAVLVACTSRACVWYCVFHVHCFVCTAQLKEVERLKEENAALKERNQSIMRRATEALAEKNKASREVEGFVVSPPARVATLLTTEVHVVWCLRCVDCLSVCRRNLQTSHQLGRSTGRVRCCWRSGGTLSLCLQHRGRRGVYVLVRVRVGDRTSWPRPTRALLSRAVRTLNCNPKWTSLLRVCKPRRRCVSSLHWLHCWCCARCNVQRVTWWLGLDRGQRLAKLGDSAPVAPKSDFKTSKQFNQLKQLLAKKNAQLAELRRKLETYEPDNVTDADAEGKE